MCVDSTKQLTVDVIRCQPGDNLTDVLSSDTTEAQEEQHRSIITQQEQVDARAEDKELAVNRSKSIKDNSDRKYVLQVCIVCIHVDLKVTLFSSFLMPCLQSFYITVVCRMEESPR